MQAAPGFVISESALGGGTDTPLHIRFSSDGKMLGWQGAEALCGMLVDRDREVADVKHLPSLVCAVCARIAADAVDH